MSQSRDTADGDMYHRPFDESDIRSDLKREGHVIVPWLKHWYDMLAPENPAFRASWNLFRPEGKEDTPSVHSAKREVRRQLFDSAQNIDQLLLDQTWHPGHERQKTIQFKQDGTTESLTVLDDDGHGQPAAWLRRTARSMQGDLEDVGAFLDPFLYALRAFRLALEDEVQTAPGALVVKGSIFCYRPLDAPDISRASTIHTARSADEADLARGPHFDPSVFSLVITSDDEGCLEFELNPEEDPKKFTPAGRTVSKPKTPLPILFPGIAAHFLGLKAVQHQVKSVRSERTSLVFYLMPRLGDNYPEAARQIKIWRPKGDDVRGLGA